jgi:hypothetical protein
VPLISIFVDLKNLNPSPDFNGCFAWQYGKLSAESLELKSDWHSPACIGSFMLLAVVNFA